MGETKPVRVGGRLIGPGEPCFVIAEAGVNHNGEVALAHRLIDAAADAGADAVKFQTFDPDSLASESAEKAAYQRARDGAGSQRDMLRRLVLSSEAHVALQRHAAERRILFMSTPFEERSADFLDTLDVPAFKIPSGEVTNHPFLAHVAKKGRVVLMSTGMCTLPEVRDAVAVLQRAGAAGVALFHCVSSYPARAEDANLRAMSSMRDALHVPVGWSDHTEGIDVSTAAVALGAELLEKHLTLDRTLPGPDHAASLEPAELAALVGAARRVFASLGDGVKEPRPAEAEVAAVARKSLHWRAALPAGHRVRAEDLIALRPGTGILPSRRDALVGSVLRTAVEARALVQEGDLG